MSAGARIMVVALVALLVSACDTLLPPPVSPSPTPLTSGVTGAVLLGPTCAHPTEADPCLAPYAAHLVVFDTDGGIVGQIDTAADGTFRLLLPPGDYVIQPAPGGDPFPRAEAQSVTVLDGELTQVEIDYEAGDRTTQAGGTNP